MQQSLIIEVKDQGPGIAEIERILQGQYRSAHGVWGLGITGVRRLMDGCEIETAPGAGAIVRMKKALPKRAPFVTAARIREICAQVADRRPQILYMKSSNRTRSC